MTPPCPICHKPAEPAHRPFCSARCRSVDLHRWLSEAYAIPGRPEEEEDEEEDGEKIRNSTGQPKLNSL